MATRDITFFTASLGDKMPGAIKAQVASGTTASINSGEPVDKLAGVNKVKAWPAGAAAGTDYIYGVSTSASTETASAVGLVDVVPATPGQFWQIAPKSASTINTQTLYNALIGKRVMFDLTGGVYTIDTTSADATGNVAIIEYNDVTVNPGKIVFSWNTKGIATNI